MSTSQSQTKRPAQLTIDTKLGRSRTASKSSKGRTPYCGVCFKAKQSATIYNSHWTRMNSNPRSPITCPLILQTVCKYCKNKGHSAKYCPVAAKKEQRRNRSRASSVSSLAPSLSDISEREERETSSSEVVASSLNTTGHRSWLQVAMNQSEPEPVETVCEPVETVSEPVETVSEPVETVSEPVEAVCEPTILSLGTPVIDDIADVFPSPPKLQRSRPRRTWDWNDDTDSDDE